VGGVEGVAHAQFEGFDDRGGIGGFGEVALAFAEMELEAFAAGGDDAFGGDLDEQLAGARFAEHETGEGAVVEGGAEVLEEFGARIGVGHREEVEANEGALATGVSRKSRGGELRSCQRPRQLAIIAAFLVLRV